MRRLAERLKRPSDRAVLLALAAMTLLALVLALWATRAIDPLRGDSAEYLYFDQSRSVGYPAFLELVRLLTGHVALAVPIQLIALAGSLLLLGWRFHGYSLRPWVSLAFQTILLAQAGMWFASAFLMTEALSTALIALWCAHLLRAMTAPSSRGTALLVALSALATMVRPSFVTLFVGTVLFIAATRPKREWPRTLVMAAAGLLLAWAATPVAQWIVHGSARTTSPLARGVLQHTLYCDPHSVPRDADSRFVEQEAVGVRRYIESAPPGVREQLRRAYSTPLRFGLIIPVLGRRHHLDERSQVDPYLSRIARERVQANPSCYAVSVAAEYLRMAVFDTDPTAEDGRVARVFIQRHPPLELAQYPVLAGDERLDRRAAAEVRDRPSGLNPVRQRLDIVADIPFLALLPIRLLFGTAALVGILALLALPVRPRLAPGLRQIVPATAAMGIVFHGTLAITAIVEIGFFRYLVPLWPLVCTLIGVAAMRFANQFFTPPLPFHGTTRSGGAGTCKHWRGWSGSKDEAGERRRASSSASARFAVER